jgi:predicted nucleotidyltransferase
MSLLQDVVKILEARGIPHALIGAAAMAVHGVSRATADVDLLTVDTAVLRRDLWKEVLQGGASLTLLKGDDEDPLAGNVRLSRAGERTVDVVVGRHAWQQEIIDSATKVMMGGFEIGVVTPAGLVLLKLDAGGPKDAWDVRSILDSAGDAVTLKAEVAGMIRRLSPEARRLWKRLRDEAGVE